MAFNMAHDSQAWLKIASDSLPRCLKATSRWPTEAEHGSKKASDNLQPSMAQDSLQEASRTLANNYGWAGG
eukprot:1826374-Pyramimonas_sp.AAC.1